MKILHKPKGEAGDRKNGFNLREAMGLEGDKQKPQYLAIIVSADCCDVLSHHILTTLSQNAVHTFTVQACVKLEDDFCETDPAKLAMVYEMVSHCHTWHIKYLHLV